MTSEQFPPHEYVRSQSLPSCPKANTMTNLSITVCDSSPQLSSSSMKTEPSSISIDQKACNMTTFYTYDHEGRLLSTSTENPGAVGSGRIDISKFEERGDAVGAYLARRASRYPAQDTLREKSHGHLTSEEGVGYQNECVESDGTCHSSPPKSNNDSYNQTNQSVSRNARTPGRTTVMEHTDQRYDYPNPEHIRHLHTLHSLLPWIYPPRRLNALNGKVLDIVEQDTGTVFAYQVSKKMLGLFLGKAIVYQFLRTTSREDNLNWKGRAVTQELRLPQGVSSKVACKILISWMEVACRIEILDHIWFMKVPHNIFAACTLAQTLSLFGLHRDAYRVEWTMSRNHLKRPIFAAEVETLWKTLGEHNRFNYAVIKHVGQRLWDHEQNQSESNKLWDEMYEMIGKYPTLENRLKSYEYNETYRPSLGTEWLENVGN